MEKKGNSIGAFRPNPLAGKKIIFPNSRLNNWLYPRGSAKLLKSLNQTNNNDGNGNDDDYNITKYILGDDEVVKIPMPPKPKQNKTVWEELKNMTDAKDWNDTIAEGLNTTEDGATKQINPDNGSNPGNTVIPASVRNRMTTGPILANSDGRRRIKVTKYTTGFKPTKAVLQLAKANGVQSRVVSDSKIEFQTSSKRNALTMGHGFNEKLYVVPANKSMMTNSDVIYNLFAETRIEAPLEISKTSTIRRTAMVMNMKKQFMIKNQSSNLALEFKIHLVKMNESAVLGNSLAETLDKSFYGPLTFDTAASSSVVGGTIPFWYQSSPYKYEIDGNIDDATFHVACSSKLKSLRRAAPNFREMFTIVETFSHTLKPEEYWNFSHIHNCGSGINIEDLMLYQTEIDNNNTGLTRNYTTAFHPYVYGVIFETKGKLCEAQVVRDSDADDSLIEVDTFLGTSPGQYLFEFKNTINFVTSSEDSEGKLCHIRIDEMQDALYNTDIFSDEMKPVELRLPYLGWKTSLPEPPLAENVGEYIIPFTTQTNSNTDRLVGSDNT